MEMVGGNVDQEIDGGSGVIVPELPLMENTNCNLHDDEAAVAEGESNLQQRKMW